MRASVERLKTSDPDIPEMVRDLLLAFPWLEREPEIVKHTIHKCACCPATWDETANE